MQAVAFLDVELMVVEIYHMYRGPVEYGEDWGLLLYNVDVALVTAHSVGVSRGDVKCLPLYMDA